MVHQGELKIDLVNVANYFKSFEWFMFAQSTAKGDICGGHP